MTELTEDARAQLQADIDKLAEELAEAQEALGADIEAFAVELETKRLGPAVQVSQEWVEDAGGVDEVGAKIQALLERVAGPRGLLANDDLIKLDSYEPSPEEKARAEALAKRDLAQRLIQWASIKESLEHVESLITESILALGYSITVGDVRAAYIKPGLTKNYQQAAANHSCNPKYNQAWQKATKKKEVTSWAKLCEYLDLGDEAIPTIEIPARVVISWDR